MFQTDHDLKSQQPLSDWKKISIFAPSPLGHDTHSLGLPPELLSKVKGILSFLMWVRTCYIICSARLSTSFEIGWRITFLKEEAGLYSLVDRQKPHLNSHLKIEKVPDRGQSCMWSPQGILGCTRDKKLNN